MTIRKQRLEVTPQGWPDIALEGLLEIPDPCPKNEAAVVAHPHPLYGGTMNNAVVYHLRAAFLEAGIAALRFNFRGVEQSTGTHSGGRGELDDVRGAADLLVRKGFRPLAFSGFSFGSLMSWWAACLRPASVSRYIGIAFPTESSNLPLDMLSELPAASFPCLFVVGENDEISKPDRVTELLSFEQEPRIVTVPAADHLFTERSWKLSVKNAVQEWLRDQGCPPLDEE